MTDKSSNILNGVIDGPDFDTVMQNDQVRKLFSTFLKEHDSSIDNLLTLYLICCCFQNNQGMDDPRRIKQVLEKTYNTCFKKNDVKNLSAELKQKLRESLQRTIYNESVFRAVKSELKSLLENEYFPKFLRSKVFADNALVIKANMPTRYNLSHKDARNVEIIASDELHLNDDAKSLGGKSNGSFVMPNAPGPKSKGMSSANRALKNSKSSSVSSSSVTLAKQPVLSCSKLAQSKAAKHSHSKSSLSSEPGALSRYKSPMPANPYHVASKAIPVSCQDSEIQSMVSGDARWDDDHLLIGGKV